MVDGLAGAEPGERSVSAPLPDRLRRALP